MRLFAVLLLVGCSAATGGAELEPSGGGSAGAPVGSAGTSAEAGTGAESSGSSGRAAEAGESVGGTAAGATAGAVTGGQVTNGGGGTASTSGAPVGGAGSAGAQSGSAGVGGSSGPKCPADFYCHTLGPDAFAKCVIRPADPDPEFPMCEITEGTCFYPKDAPEECITADCWSEMRTCG